MSVREIQCPVCGKVFARTYNAQKFCSIKCRDKAYRNSRAPKRVVLECLWCGKEFETDRRRKYCCDKCRQKANNSLKRKPAPRKKVNLTLAKINELARAEGLNYGQYVAKYGL